MYGGTPVLPSDFTHPTWPIINDEFKQAVTNQMDRSMSIYNRSDVFEEFENIFAKRHGAKYALLNNSGTNSIWAMLVGAGVGPGDEVICPTYTFFATNTPILSCGARPVFCDAGTDGNISPESIESHISERTRAIIITHMWGYPCDMDKICALAKKYKILLFEDCSHAHLATYKGQNVGSFGDAAAWSLQGQKNITGGEGGILITNDQDIYIRANLLGHYNKRCKDEIPKDHALYKFAVTGMGLKHRAHPLAVAFANLQLKKHSEYQKVRNECANRYDSLFEKYDFVEPVKFMESEPSWYAYILKYTPPSNKKVNREVLVSMLHAEGLCEVDIPGSTSPNHLQPLFKEPWVLFPQFYKTGELFNTHEFFPGAEVFYNSIVKLPTWVLPEHLKILDRYVEGLGKVLDYVNSI